MRAIVSTKARRRLRRQYIGSKQGPFLFEISAANPPSEEERGQNPALTIAAAWTPDETLGTFSRYRWKTVERSASFAIYSNSICGPI
jgi:hypothetical protein